MTAITEGKIVLVEKHSSGVQITTFNTRLQMVAALLREASIGGGLVFGDDGHQLALRLVENKILEVRSDIQRENGSGKN